jgi:hypothetical protein
VNLITTLELRDAVRAVHDGAHVIVGTGDECVIPIPWLLAADVRDVVTALGVPVRPDGQISLRVPVAGLQEAQLTTTARMYDGYQLLANAIVSLDDAGRLEPDGDGGIRIRIRYRLHSGAPPYVDLLEPARKEQASMLFGAPAKASSLTAEILATLLRDNSGTTSGLETPMAWGLLAEQAASFSRWPEPLASARALALDPHAVTPEPGQDGVTNARTGEPDPAGHAERSRRSVQRATPAAPATPSALAPGATNGR